MPVNLVATPAADLYPVPGVRWGITEAGIRKVGRKDLSVLLLDEGASVGAVFTQNRFCAAPVQLCREHLAKNGGKTLGIRAMLINTGNANAGTGADGLNRAQSSCIALARRADPAFFDGRDHGALAP
jgi:glutamate N-acetyltransferase / amino-acid N-acetyltransferase